MINKLYLLYEKTDVFFMRSFGSAVSASGGVKARSSMLILQLEAMMTEKPVLRFSVFGITQDFEQNTYLRETS
jgi:hypothetical protein